MGEQTVDLRAVGTALRRQRGAIALVGLLGAVLGAGMPLVRPPMYTSTSEVLLPAPAVVQGRQADPATQLEIASSEAVLGKAGRIAAPELTFPELGKRVEVTAPSEQTIKFSAQAPTAAKARQLASELTTAELAYIAQAAGQEKDGSLTTTLQKLSKDVASLQQTIRGKKGTDSPVAAALSAELATVTGQLQTLTATAAPTPGVATVLQAASTPTRPGIVSIYVLPAALGLIIGLLLAAIGVLIGARMDRRLRSRDQLATVVGRAAIASFGGRSARSIGAWHHLIAKYDASPVDGWALRQVLHQIPTDAEGRRTVTVVGLENDPRGMALGPLLASYAAAAGVSTELVIADGTRPVTMVSTLRRVVGSELRPGLHVSAGTPSGAADLTVVVVVASATEVPSMPTERTETPVLVGLAAGAATAAQAAYAAMAADAAGRLLGLVVVDPDAGDRTHGQIAEPPKHQSNVIPATTKARR